MVLGFTGSNTSIARKGDIPNFPGHQRPKTAQKIRNVPFSPPYGLDLDETTSPLEAGLGWTVKFDKPDFIGRDALRCQRDKGVGRSLALVAFPDMDFVPAPGDAILADGRAVGKVTSADRGWHLRKSLALGYVEPAMAKPGTAVSVKRAADGAARQGIVGTAAPYDPDRKRARA